MQDSTGSRSRLFGNQSLLRPSLDVDFPSRDGRATKSLRSAPPGPNLDLDELAPPYSPYALRLPPPGKGSSQHHSILPMTHIHRGERRECQTLRSLAPWRGFTKSASGSSVSSSSSDYSGSMHSSIVTCAYVYTFLYLYFWTCADDASHSSPLVTSLKSLESTTPAYILAMGPILGARLNLSSRSGEAGSEAGSRRLQPLARQAVVLTAKGGEG
ncbi:hypothetical protein GYMLUDRAFT_243173 [Collybiopsis luxurians FD-317 M1]|uniref:Uncharacterized protein n=1 Tax=Collybiopsis luxurians FD-317 M1 TaxID=944289 RepID=A0A0D0BE62_9AGAR|nr:hypothetical protein GYMLUDRAFT_243173 [Collybiopsis luxurians FD-317 M1]